MSSLNQNVIRHKIGLLNLATELGNVSCACKLMGLSRDTFYRYQNAVAVADGGVEALFDANRRRPKMCCGRTPLQTLIAGKEAWQEKVDNLN